MMNVLAPAARVQKGGGEPCALYLPEEAYDDTRWCDGTLAQLYF